ncbi:hypothetical protein EVAR_49798_1 [Eumeta japonica]|uniref:Uncharacterized protein n=1 Tax=Eumeta variegata TaxID=151549 RepID=A0A4C1YW72_EUMVA|nr:hypothetical protein EVAR_49798_1 [Eumeta japonica]
MRVILERLKTKCIAAVIRDTASELSASVVRIPRPPQTSLLSDDNQRRGGDQRRFRAARPCASGPLGSKLDFRPAARNRISASAPLLRFAGLRMVAR